MIDKHKTGNVIFACGYSIDGVPDPRPVASHVERDGQGRVRLAVYDSESDTMRRPQNPGELRDYAECWWSCPCKKKSKRKADRCYPSGEYDKSRTFETQCRRVVTCYGTWYSDAEMN